MKFTRSLMIGVAAAGLMASGAQAADLLLPADPAVVYDDVAFSFEGFYVGAQAGGAWFTTDDGVVATDSSAGVVGVVAGANFMVSDAILAGLEFQGDWYWGGNGAPSAADALILGRVGAVVTDNVLVYAAAGVGIIGGDAFPGGSETYWAAGGGIEVGVTDNLGVRGEVLYKDNFNSAAVDVRGVQATVGLIWHIN